MTTFKLPDLGEGLEDSEIVTWHVAEGDRVELNQVLADVETAKAVVELPSPYAGTITKLHASAGETVLVGAPLIDFDADVDDDDEAPKAPEPASDDLPLEAPALEQEAAAAQEDGEDAGLVQSGDRVQVLVGSMKVQGKERPKRRARAWDAAPFEREARAASGPVRVMPPVRALAKQRGIDLSSVRASGEDGLVTRADLESHIATSAVAPAASRQSRRERVSGLRKHTAAAMTKSAFEAPHAAVFLEVDVSETMALVQSMKAAAKGETTPSFLAMCCKAIMSAAKRNPDVNATFHADSGEIEVHEAINLGIAVSTDRGLVVASIDDADLMTGIELTEAIADRAVRGREAKLSPAELTSSTLTVSNVGVFGVDGGVPILNPGESAILALGTVRKKPWEYRGEIALRQVMQISVSFDHRVVDGKEASSFIADIGRLLEQPGRALAL